MKAWVSRTAGGPDTLELEERPIPEPAAGEVRIRVKAVGVNYPDALLIRDLYQVKPPRPLVPGGELSGVVDAVGVGASRVEPGVPVIARCGWGAMAEYVVVAQERCEPIPSNLCWAEAAAFQFTYATAYHALHDAAKLRPGETLLVLGAAGGIGSAAVEVGRALGAQVVAAASSEVKLQFARSLGAHDGLVYAGDMSSEEAKRALARQLKDKLPEGIHVVLDPIGGPYTESVLRHVVSGGRHLVVGFTAGIPRIPTNLVLLRGRRLIGVDWRTFCLEQPESNSKNVAELLTLWQQGSIRPRVTRRLAFGEAPVAVACLESRHAVGKIVITIGAGTDHTSH